MPALAIFIFAGAAQAEVITCNFTEPFITMAVNREAGQVTVSDFEIERTVAILEVSQTPEGGTRVVFGAGEEENSVLTFIRDGEGSDGMSDLIYPYSAQTWTGDTHPLFGGCQTASDPAHK